MALGIKLTTWASAAPVVESRRSYVTVLPLVRQLNCQTPPGRLTATRPCPDNAAVFYGQKHLLQIEGLHPPEIGHLLDLAESYVLLNRSGKAQRDLLRGRTLINLFFEDSTRTRTSFELAGKRLGADVINMSVSTSSVNKGETLLDTAATLNAMRGATPLVVRHAQSGAPRLLADTGGCRGDQCWRRYLTWSKYADPGTSRRADH